MDIRYYLVVLMACFYCSTGSADIYKWVDKNGKTHYGDKPPQAAKKTNVDRRSTSHRIAPAFSSKNIVIKLRRLFEERQYSTISQILNKLQAQTKANIAKELTEYRSYLAFEYNDEFYEQGFNDWIKQEPNDFYAYLARSKYYLAMGWKSRGSKRGNKTSEQQFQLMRSYFSKAKRDLTKATLINPTSMMTYSFLISIAKAESEMGLAKQILSKAIRIKPASYLVRNIYIGLLMPKWGGLHNKNAFIC